MSRTYRKKKKATPGQILVFILLLVGSLAMLLPFLWMALSSLKTQTELLQMPPTIFPKQPTLKNYQRVLEGIPFLQYYANSLVTGVLNTVVGLFTSCIAGYIFAKYEFRGKNVLFLTMLACMMIPYDTLMVPLYRIMVAFHWTNTFLVLTVPYFVNIFGIFLMRQFMQDIPKDFIDAAEIDGCGQFRTFRSVILPIVRPVMAALCIFLFMASWNSYIWPLISVNSRDLFTLPVGLGAFQNDRGRQVDLIMAASTMTVLPICIVFLAAQKHFVQGITMAGIKG